MLITAELKQLSYYSLSQLMPIRQYLGIKKDKLRN